MVRIKHFQRRPYKDRSSLNLNPEISRGLLAIFLFIVAGVSTLSFFSMAGVAGQFIDSLLSVLFGHVRYLFPLVLIATAVLLIKDSEYNFKNTSTIGAVLFFLSVNGIVHLQKPLSEMLDTALQGYGGGMVGLALSWLLLKYVGYWGSLLILIGLFLVAIILLFQLSLQNLLNFGKILLVWIKEGGQYVFSAFNKNKKQLQQVSFSITGDYAKERTGSANKETDAEAEEDQRIFKQKTVAREEEAWEETETEETTAKKSVKTSVPRPVIRNLPSLDLLYTSKTKPSAGDIKSNAEIIKETFKNFGIGVDMGEVRVGPTVTQFSLKPEKGIKLARITALSNDLSLALAAHPIRIEAPIPGQSLVGIEVPNQKVAIVTLRELLESAEFVNRRHNIMIALGKDVAGKVWFADLPNMPHLLIAGATGSGKTVCINTIISSLLYQNTAATLRFIMVDPKRVELTLYNGIPHLLTPVITDVPKTVNALKWTIGEMERRFDMLASAGKRDIASYNEVAPESMPHIIFIIDELADLMAMAGAEVEAGVIRIAQMARAVGIHLIVATQRPSVEVITGLIKANIPARIAFSVASLIDSRTILDCPGAEKLLGRGDMLFLTAELSKPKRLQGAYVSEEEIDRVVEHLKGDEPPAYDESIVSKNSNGGGTVNLFGGLSDDQDALFEEAKRVVVESGKASASLLQRRLKVGYARAARLLDEMEEAGIVGPADGAKPREVFTEHLRPADNAEIPFEEQTMDAGGTVFEHNENETTNETKVEQE